MEDSDVSHLGMQSSAKGYRTMFEEKKKQEATRESTLSGHESSSRWWWRKCKQALLYTPGHAIKNESHINNPKVMYSSHLKKILEHVTVLILSSLDALVRKKFGRSVNLFCPYTSLLFICSNFSLSVYLNGRDVLIRCYMRCRQKQTFEDIFVAYISPSDLWNEAISSVRCFSFQTSVSTTISFSLYNACEPAIFVFTVYLNHREYHVQQPCEDGGSKNVSGSLRTCAQGTSRPADCSPSLHGDWSCPGNAQMGTCRRPGYRSRREAPVIIAFKCGDKTWSVIVIMDLAAQSAHACESESARGRVFLLCVSGCEFRRVYLSMSAGKLRKKGCWSEETNMTCGWEFIEFHCDDRTGRPSASGAWKDIPFLCRDFCLISLFWVWIVVYFLNFIFGSMYFFLYIFFFCSFF